ncbi:MAG: glycosyltransferase family 4 protein [Acidimicrobiales bacterium]
MRLAYVLPLDRRPEPPSEQLERFPHNQRMLGTLVARHGVGAHAVWSSTHRATIAQDGVTHHFTPQLVRTVRQLAPDVVHVNGLVFPRLVMALRLALLGGSRRKSGRLVLQHHGEVPGSARSLWAQRLARRLVDGYLFCGLPGQAEPWRRARVLAPHTPLFEVLEASSDLPFNAPAASADGPNVLWIGRLLPGKDPLTAVEAFDRFAATNPRARLWMVGTGSGPLRDAVAGRLGARACLVGPFTQAVLAGWYERADVIFSTSWHEGSGYALIEAIGCGCTPAVTDLPSHRVIAGSDGAYFRPGDAAAAAQALDRAAQRASEPGVRAAHRRRFERELSWEQVCNQLMAAYRGG